MKAARRPPGPAPLRLEMLLEDANEAIVFEIDREAEPTIAARVEELVGLNAYDGARLRVKSDTAAIELASDPAPRLVEPRRVRHSAHKVGAVSWAWSRVPSDGVGELFFSRRDEPGYDASYQTVGWIVGGLETLLGLEAEPERKVRGQRSPAPAVIYTIRRAELGIAAAR